MVGTVTVSVAWRGAASAPGGVLGSGSSYTTVISDPTTGAGLNMSGQSSAFGVRGAVGFKATAGDPFNQTIALGIQVPSLTGNGFVPLALATFGGSVTGTAQIERHLELVELFDHDQNGKRRDTYGPSGTCWETYTVNGITFTSGGVGEFVPGQTASDGFAGLPSYFPRGLGIQTTASATSQRGGLGSGAYSGGDISVVWSMRYEDADGNSLFGEPDAPTTASAIGSTSWGQVKANACAAAGRHTATATVQFLPRHSFEVTMAPRSLPWGAPHTVMHRLVVGWRNPTGGTVPSAEYEFTSSGETVSLPCGGTKWSAILSSTVTGETGEGRTTNYNSLLPLVNSLQVTTGDAQPHFYAHVRGSWSCMGIAQAGAVNVPGGSGLSVAVGTQTLNVGQSVGYRWLRVRAKTPTGTGSLSISTFLNGNTTTATATETLTTTVADTVVELDIDMLSVPGCTPTDTLRLEKIVLTATGADFTVVTTELIRKVENIVQVLSSRRALFPLAMDKVLPWLRCYTDGILSYGHYIRGFTSSGDIELRSFTPRQLVQEINGTTRTTYAGTWSPPFPYIATDAGAGGAAGALIGWTATDNCAPRPGKGYGLDEVYEPEDWEDSDVYLPALHGDGIIGSALQLVTPTGTIYAQRFAQVIEPGILPGLAGFDGTDGEEFGETQETAHNTTPVRFVALYAGIADGMIIGEPRYLPTFETDIIVPGVGTTPIVPPVSVGDFIPRTTGSDFAHSNQPLRGERQNGFRVNTIENDGGTPTDGTLSPYNRDRVYKRFWTGGTTELGAIEHDPARGWIHQAEGEKIVTYSREDQAEAGGALRLVKLFSSDDLGIGTIRRMRVMVGGRLLVLASSGSVHNLYLSGDGGKTVAEILSMTNAASSLVEYDPARNWVLVFWEDATSHQVYRRISRDGGDSWESAVAVQWTPSGGSLTNLVGELLDSCRVGELAGRLVATVKVSSVGKTIMSGDGGLAWSQVL